MSTTPQQRRRELMAVALEQAGLLPPTSTVLGALMADVNAYGGVIAVACINQQNGRACSAFGECKTDLPLETRKAFWYELTQRIQLYDLGRTNAQLEDIESKRRALVATIGDYVDAKLLWQRDAANVNLEADAAALEVAVRSRIADVVKACGAITNAERDAALEALNPQ